MRLLHDVRMVNLLSKPIFSIVSPQKVLMSTITKEILVNRIHSALSAELSAFLNQSSAEDLAFQQEITALRQQAETANYPAIAAGIRQTIKELESKRPDMSIARRQEAALAVLIVTNAFRLPLQIKGSSPVEVKPAKSAKGESSGKRMSRASMRQLLESLLKAFPPVGQAIGISDLAEKVGASVSDTRSAILRLKREKKVAPNGARGRGGAWVRQ